MVSVNDFSKKQILYLHTKDDEKLSFKNDNITVKDKDGKIIAQASCFRIFAVFIVGNISITSGLLQRAKKYGIGLVFLTPYYRPYQTISSAAEGNTLLRRKQYAYEGVGAAIRLTANKISNQKSNLQSIRGKSDDQKAAISLLDGYAQKVYSCSSIAEIMGIEGNASKVYFRNYFDNVVWKGRKPRIKFDMTNALLDMGYTMLFNYIDSMLSLYGFDRYNGVLHRRFYMRKSLVCDMVEPFRVIIDRAVKKGINLGQFKEKDFDIRDGAYRLKIKKNPDYSKVFISSVLEYKTEIFVYIRDVYRCFMKEKLETELPGWRIDE